MKTTLLVAAWNELEGMKAIMPQIKRDWVDQILIVDGQSTDGTAEWAREQGYEVVVQQKPGGLRYGYYDALPHIKGDVVITFSPDGNSLADKIPALVEKMKEGYDMVIVSRYLGEAKSEDDDILTAFGNWFFTKTVNVLHGGQYTDSMVIFRAFKKQIIYDLDLDKEESYALPEKLFRCKLSWEPLLSVRAAKRRLKVGEIPGDEPPRIGGERKLKVFKWGAAFYFQFLREVFFWK
ncbi:MAG: glycosyltransferase family 2 protein [Elusimicrobiota bacterium]|nr:glycosyltransferase family 2 protein [Elusimicrobiota bacterium]